MYLHRVLPLLLAALTGAAASIAAGTVAAQPAGEILVRKTVTCHSNDSKFQRCNVHGWEGAQLLRQVSKTPCVRGQNWDVDGEWLWVSGGCRADFGEVRRDAPRHGTEAWVAEDDTVACHSNQNKFQRCQVGPWPNARLVRQDSRTPCVRGDNWDLDGTSIWVSGGCRAAFARADSVQLERRSRPRTGSRISRPRRSARHPRSAPPPAGSASPIAFACESLDQQRNFCAIAVGARGSVELTQQDSRAACVEGSSWGWQADGIWVDAGCRAQFRVHRAR